MLDEDGSDGGVPREPALPREREDRTRNRGADRVEPGRRVEFVERSAGSRQAGPEQRSEPAPASESAQRDALTSARDGDDGDRGAPARSRSGAFVRLGQSHSHPAGIEEARCLERHAPVRIHERDVAGALDPGEARGQRQPSPASQPPRLAHVSPRSVRYSSSAAVAATSAFGIHSASAAGNSPLSPRYSPKVSNV